MGGLLRRPAILIGAARSGTKMLAETLNRHPELFVLREPTAVWRYGRAYSPTDLRPASDAKPAVCAYIRRAFEKELRASGKPRFAEKTPSNCLRMPFIRQVFPDALFLHLLRDGRDATASAVDTWKGMRDRSIRTPRQADTEKRPRGSLKWVAEFMGRVFKRKMHIDDWRSLLETPAYLPWAVGLARRHLLNSSKPLWGPRVPGLRHIRKTYPLLETCALQWEACVRMAVGAGRQMEPNRYLEIRYEELVNNAPETTARALQFLDLPYDERLLEEMTRHIRPYPLPKWPTALSEEQLRRVERLIGTALEQTGYPLAAKP